MDNLQGIIEFMTSDFFNVIGNVLTFLGFIAGACTMLMVDMLVLLISDKIKSKKKVIEEKE